MTHRNQRWLWNARSVLLVALGLSPWLAAAAAETVEPLRWRWSHPQPHGNNVIDMAWSSAGAYWLQAAEQGTLYTSRDGFSWIPRKSGTRLALRGVAFMGQRAIVTGEAGTVLYADDPSDFRPGELADGPTDDWLEGVAASSARAVAVGDHGAIYTSTNGVLWTRVNSGVDHWLRGVAHGGGLFVAVGDQGTILASPNGADWTPRSSPTSADLNRVTHTPNGFLAVGDGGVALFSQLGNSWSLLNSGATRDLFTAAGTALDLLVAGDNQVRVRIQAAWSDELARPDGPLPGTYLASVGHSDSVFIAGRAGMMAEGFRLGAGPYQWFLRSSPLRPVLFDGFWASNLFVAVGDQSTIMTSVDAVDWSYEYPPATLTNRVLLGVGGNTNLLVAAGNAGTLMVSRYGLMDVVTTNDHGLVITQKVNTLGVVWEAVDPAPTSEDLQGVCFWNDRTYVTGNAGLVLSSPDGAAWEPHPAPTAQFLSSIAGSPVGLVATGNRGAVLHSSDGQTWSAIEPFTTNWIYRVRWLTDRFLGVGQGGTMISSTNGLDWTMHDSGTRTWLTDVRRVAGNYYAVGLGGTVLVSTNTWDWRAEGTITRKTLYTAFTDHDRLVVAGDEGVILRTPILSAPTPVNFLAFDRSLHPEGNAWENYYLFSGQPDQRFTLDYTDALGPDSWRDGPTLEFRDASGTLLYREIVPVTESSDLELHRTTTPPT